MRRPSHLQRFGIGLQDLARRLNGVSTPLGCLSWEAPAAERDQVRAFLARLEDRRVLFAPYQAEVEFAVARSVEEIRQVCTDTIASLPEHAKATGSVRAIRAACRRFLTAAPDVRDLYRSRYDLGERVLFFIALGELRATVGLQVAILAVGYAIEVEGELASVLPPDVDEDHEGEGT